MWGKWNPDAADHRRRRAAAGVGGVRTRRRLERRLFAGPVVDAGRAGRLVTRAAKPEERMIYQTIRYDVDGPIACITLNRPDELNTIVPPMPDEIEAAVNGAVADPHVKVVLVRGAGR